MSEIGKSEIGKINTSYSTQQLGIKNNPKEEKAEERTEIKEFNNPGAEAIGRAGVITDNLNSDIKKIIEAPSILDDSEKLYEVAEQVAIANGTTSNKYMYLINPFAEPPFERKIKIAIEKANKTPAIIPTHKSFFLLTNIS